MTTSEVTPQQKIDAIIRVRGLSNAEAARQLFVTDQCLLNWRKELSGGGKLPSEPYRRAIEKWTADAVFVIDGVEYRGPILASSWANPEEREIVERVTPFEPKAA